MTTARRVRWITILLAFIFLFLTGCRQDEQQPEQTAVPTQPANPTSAISAAEPTISSGTISTPLPFPATPAPTSAISQPSPTPPSQEAGQSTIGFSVQNRPILAYWAGLGERKVVLIGGHEQAQLWISHFQTNAETIPPGLSLWFVPNPNPDSPDPGGFLNTNGVNLLQNADSRFAACPEQTSEPGTGGPYPFSEPESRALRDVAADSWITILLTAGSNSIYPGGCGSYPNSNTLAALLANSSGLAVGNAAINKGHLVDYLVGEGTAAAVMGQEEMSTAVIDVILQNLELITAAEAANANGSFKWIDENNSSEWLFPTGTFIHPLALEIIGQHIYILDSGQVLRLNRQTPGIPEPILSPDDEVAGVRVIEPVDLAMSGQSLLVLDRAGDVYGYDPGTAEWTLHRYDRPVSETSSHYYVALASQPALAGRHFLLEGSYHFALDQGVGRPDFIWPLPEHHQVDITTNQGQVYILSQSPISQTAALTHYQDGAKDDNFFSRLPLHRPRQVQAAGSGVYILDNGGRRLAAMDAATGQLNTIYKPADGRPWSAFLVNEEEGQILLAGQDKLTFFGKLEEVVVIQGAGTHSFPQINDPQVLENLRGLLMPIGGSDITLRENQMPGAPRHYRYGVHEGADFYWHSGTPVRAVAAGTVIRATIDYQIPTQEVFSTWSFRVQTLGYTSADAHDFYRGMQVWIEHEGGLISRYVHLSAIDNMIREGVTIEAGQIIGAVGNTGSPVSLEGPDTDAHLHFELWLAGHYLGQFLRPIETREWLEVILNAQ